jgi:heme A synthase
MTTDKLLPRALAVTVIWTLVLLFLGSVVHATGSSLACPDWPTCYGTMVPNMTGGVFWEHLHRLVAGGLVLMFSLTTWIAHREAPAERRWIVRACWAGIGLLLVQSVFGGLTVLYRLPDMVSTTHLALAFGFLALATLLAAITARPEEVAPGANRGVRRWAVSAASLVFAQCVSGALVRHMEAGMACPDVPLCLGRVVPPLVNAPIIAHFMHRVLAVIAALVVIAMAVRIWRGETSPRTRKLAALATGLVLAQVGLGVASVLTVLSVLPVSLHTLFAASLLASLVWLATVARTEDSPDPVPTAAAAARAA